MSSANRILIGKVVGASGIKGEIKVYHYSNDLKSFLEYTKVYLNDTCYALEGARHGKGTTIAKLQGVDDRNAAEALVDFDVYIEEEALGELPEDVYYVRDLIGLEVKDEQGNTVGTLKDVLQNTAQDVYVVDTADGDVLVPSVKEFVKNVDMDNGHITIQFIEGMLP